MLAATRRSTNMKRLALIAVAGLCLIVAAILWRLNSRRQHAFSFTQTLVASSSAALAASEPAPPPDAPDDWPQWRGPNRDGVSPATNLLRQWPADGPPLLWTAKGLGRGMSSVSVADGRIFTMGNRDGAGVCLIALSADTGEQLWSTPLDAQGDPNGTPTIHGDQVFAIAFSGVLVCANAESGQISWR